MSNKRIIHSITSRQYTTWPALRVVGWSLSPRPTKNDTTAKPSRIFHLLDAQSLNLFPSVGGSECRIWHDKNQGLKRSNHNTCQKFCDYLSHLEQISNKHFWHFAETKLTLFYFYKTRFGLKQHQWRWLVLLIHRRENKKDSIKNLRLSSSVSFINYINL